MVFAVQFSLSVVSDSLRPHGLQHGRPSLFITNSWRMLKLMSIESVMPSNYLILCCPPLLPPSIFPSIRVFSNESVLLIRWPKDWSFSFSISPSNDIQDWFPLGLTGLISLQSRDSQHHSSKAYIFWYSDFFIVQLSHPYMTPGKPMALLQGSLLAK